MRYTFFDSFQDDRQEYNTTLMPSSPYTIYNDGYYYSDNYNYTETYMQTFGLSRSASFYTGIGYILFACLSLVLYTRLLLVIIYDKELNQLSAYRIILQNGFADCIMLTMWIISGIFSVYLSTFNSIFAKIMGAIDLFGIHASGSFSLLLSINRFIQMVFTHRITEIFGKKLTSIYIIIVWLTSAPIAIISLTSFVTRRYYPYWCSWAFMSTTDRRNVMININNYLTIAKILVSAVLYFITIISMIYQRQNVSKSEVRLTIQTMIDVLFRISGVIYYQLSLLDLALDNSFTVNGTIMDSVLIFIANAVNVYIYITFNRVLRRKFLPKIIRQKLCRSSSVGIN